jgi:hypothetical protein
LYQKNYQSLQLILMRKLIIYFFLIIPILGFSQKKIYEAKQSTEKIVVDGKLNESIWKTAPIATNFVTFQPDNGKPIAEKKRTEVRLVYDNDGVYIAATMFDDEPSKILKEITQRDNIGTTDFFGVFINGFNDNQQEFRFFVTASNVQQDAIATDATGEDTSWDAVWLSKAVVTDFGWVVEMKIPYAALRFSSENKQTWGLNFFREIRRDRQKYTWNLIDAKNNSTTQQAGILTGIQNIKPPTRLFLLPYSSFYVNGNKTLKTKGTLKGGLDVKYGINDAFTLDAILVPDFGQTRFDDQILNLGPFEQQFNENRLFFTEGTDLFAKGNLFYSRRIGGSPTVKPTINNNEEIVETPSAVNLINATKISGRTKNGLGIGFLNAVSENTFAIVRNKTTGELRKELVEPLANFNVLVFDQRFNKNSSVSLINTNVTRNGSYRDANVTAAVWDFNTRANTYNISGDLKYSYVNERVSKKGVNSQLNFAETAGKYRYSIGGDVTSKNYDNNDLGINFETNFYSLYGNASYRILNPTKIFNTLNTNLNIYNQFHLETHKPQSSNINWNLNTTTKDNHYIGFGLNGNPVKTYDYYEPRAENRFMIFPERIRAWIYVSTNYNYKFAFDFNPEFVVLNEKNRRSYGLSLGPRYRFSDKLLITYNFDYNQRLNNRGWVDSQNTDSNPATANDIVFANRTTVTYSNNLSAKYAINSDMTFNLSIRQYWSYAENNRYLLLNQDGTFSDFDSYTKNRNSSFNSWNMDLSYVYWFAPGSQISILYRNNSSSFERDINKNFDQNLTNILTNDRLNHIFSISIRYFIDYNQAKNWFKKA